MPDAFLVMNDDISFDHPFGIHIFDACLHHFSILARMVHSIQAISDYNSQNEFLGLHQASELEHKTRPNLNNKETTSDNPRLKSGRRSFLTSIANLNPKSNLYIMYKVLTLVELGL